MGDTEENATDSLPQGVYNLVENKLYNIRQKMIKIFKGGLDKASWMLRRREMEDSVMGEGCCRHRGGELGSLYGRKSDLICWSERRQREESKFKLDQGVGCNALKLAHHTR